MADVSRDEIDAIRLHLQRQYFYGPDRFRRAIEAQLGRSLEPRKVGRPRQTPTPPRHANDREKSL